MLWVLNIILTTILGKSEIDVLNKQPPTKRQNARPSIYLCLLKTADLFGASVCIGALARPRYI